MRISQQTGGVSRGEFQVSERCLRLGNAPWTGSIASQAHAILNDVDVLEGSCRSFMKDNKQKQLNDCETTVRIHDQLEKKEKMCETKTPRKNTSHVVISHVDGRCWDAEHFSASCRVTWCSGGSHLNVPASFRSTLSSKVERNTSTRVIKSSRIRRKIRESNDS